jgi:hypothetical protein
MSFHQSAVSFELDDDHVLKAVLRNEDGNKNESELDLNDIIGNSNGTVSLPCLRFTSWSTEANHFIGSFEWGGENFKDSADGIELHREGDEEVPILRAKLNNLDGDEVDADINLAERITNDNGNLVFV